MGRKRKIEIEKEEYRKIAELFQQIVGDRSYIEVARLGGFDPSPLSYICRGKVKPTPDIIEAITKPEANPQGGVSREELMYECGYQSDTMGRMLKYAEGLFFSKEDNLTDKEKIRSVMGAQAIYDKKCNKCRSLLMEGIIDKGFSILSSKRKFLVNNAGGRIDVAFEITNTDSAITDWWFCFGMAARVKVDEGYRYTQVIFGDILKCGKLDENQKLSFIIFDKASFDALSEFRDRIPYRGELSVIYVNLENEEIVDEVYLSHYIDGNTENEIYIK